MIRQMKKTKAQTIKSKPLQVLFEKRLNEISGLSSAQLHIFVHTYT